LCPAGLFLFGFWLSGFEKSFASGGTGPSFEEEDFEVQGGIEKLRKFVKE